jgi:hypothetical protein
MQIGRSVEVIAGNHGLWFHGQPDQPQNSLPYRP